MAYAVVSAYSGASKTTVTIGGVSYDVYQFASTAGGSIEFSAGGTVDVLIVGGGGPGGFEGFGGGGGGSGGDVIAATVNASAGLANVLVGAGEVSVLRGPKAGQPSAALGLTALGGGHGGQNGIIPIDGGGGNGRNESTTRLGIAHPSGFKGGDGHRESSNPPRAGGGGRGAGGNGGNAVPYLEGTGGAGITSSITGLATTYGRGGDGGHYGNGSEFAIDGKNPGDGGQGAHSITSANGQGGKGANGVVILRVAAPVAAPSIPGPGKLDLFNARQIKTAAGEWMEAKGQGWHWGRQP